MNHSEKTIAAATVGLVVTAIGTFLPWSRIGGRNRSGYDTADTFIALASGALPDAVAWIGRWWYLPAFLVVVAWAIAFFERNALTRILLAVLPVLSLAMWWLFVWAGHNYGVLKVQLVGPTVSTVGVVLFLATTVRRGGRMFSNGGSA